MLGRRRRRFVGAVMVLGGVNAKTADLDKARQRLTFAGIEENAEVVDVGFDVIVMRAPVADFRGAVDENIRLDQCLPQRRAVRRLATNDSNAGRFKGLGVAAWASECGNVPLTALTRL